MCSGAAGARSNRRRFPPLPIGNGAKKWVLIQKRCEAKPLADDPNAIVSAGPWRWRGSQRKVVNKGHRVRAGRGMRIHFNSYRARNIDKIPSLCGGAIQEL